MSVVQKGSFAVMRIVIALLLTAMHGRARLITMEVMILPAERTAVISTRVTSTIPTLATASDNMLYVGRKIEVGF